MLVWGDSLAHLKTLTADSVDCVVTDPPYGLAFMGKKWDYDVPSKELWAEVLRVLKPGGHLLSFGGTRTYHRMVVQIEDAGFEIRDQIMWIYGSGFPKSLDVSKAIDKAAGAEREVIGINPSSRPNSKVIGNKGFDAGLGNGDSAGIQSITAPSTDAAKRWQGWGTALKPANEPIVLARKPLEKGLTVAENVLKWGTGALNIDGTRIGSESRPLIEMNRRKMEGSNTFRGSEDGTTTGSKYAGETTQGRWPANVLFDEEAAAGLDAANIKEQPARYFYCAKASKRERNVGLEGMPTQVLATSTGQTRPNKPARLGADPHAVQEPVANHHPTVKPVKLMEYLIKLVCPPGGIVLDPFMGSGTTGVAAAQLDCEFIGIEREAEYIEIAKRRIQHVQPR